MAVMGCPGARNMKGGGELEGCRTASPFPAVGLGKRNQREAKGVASVFGIVGLSRKNRVRRAQVVYWY